MTKHKVTKQQRANAHYALRVMWPFIEVEDIVCDLSDWRCGSQACFGGHVALDPYFQRQGVHANYRGAPQMAGITSTEDVSERLFGVMGMFSSRQQDEEGTDHEIVTKRLKALIRMTKVQKD